MRAPKDMLLRNLTITSFCAVVSACVPPATPNDTEDKQIIGESTSSEYASSVSSGFDAGEQTSSAPGMSAHTPDTSFIHEDFETSQLGYPPASWQTFTGYVVDDAAASQTLFVDDSQAHSGQQSLRVIGGANGPTQIVQAIPTPLKTLYLRAWFYADISLGNRPENTDNHEHLLGTRAQGDNSETFSSQREIRVGQSKGHLGFNLPSISDAVSPSQAEWWSGAQTPVREWFCVEAWLDTTEAYDELTMSLNSNEVNAVRNASHWHTDVPGNWSEGLMSYVFFGWHSFSQRSANLWVDDILVATDPMGCE